MDNNVILKISKRSFISSVCILLVLMTIAGIFTLIIPSGSFERVNIGGKEVIDLQSYTLTEKTDLPFYRWFTAPIELLFADGATTVIVVTLFLLFMSGTFEALDKAGVLKAILEKLVSKFVNQRYMLIRVVCLVFMIFGALLGMVEELLPMVPIVLTLAYTMGWDSLMGLGMSLLAAGFGFAGALTNPFSIGIAQQIAELPLFSGLLFRVIIFITVYVILSSFLVRYAKKIDDNPKSSLVYEEDKVIRETYKFQKDSISTCTMLTNRMKLAVGWFALFILITIVTLVFSAFVPILSDLAMPMVGLLFFIGGIGSAIISGIGTGKVFKSFLNGFRSMLPAILLIIMAVSVGYIIEEAGVMDTILYKSALLIRQVPPTFSVLLIYFLVLFLELFITSASAKAFLVMPIIAPLADLIGLTRQTVVQAYCFGDGFSNMIYPTNLVLLIALGLTPVTFLKWFKWTGKHQLLTFAVTVVFLVIAVWTKYGPF